MLHWEGWLQLRDTAEPESFLAAPTPCHHLLHRPGHGTIRKSLPRNGRHGTQVLVSSRRVVLAEMFPVLGLRAPGCCCFPTLALTGCSIFVSAMHLQQESKCMLAFLQH